MNHVMLIGAGATLAESISSRPARDKTPPLDRTFFELCRLAKFPQIGQVQRYMINNYGLDPLSNDHRMEEVFNFIYSDVFSSAPPPRCYEAYWSLIRMYANAIARTTNRLTAISRFGVGSLLRHVWSTDPDPHITFVTFNQDLVIEKAIQQASETQTYSSIPWNIRLSYSSQFSEWKHFAARAKPFKSEGDTSIRVLKLHGSLNWVYVVRSDTDPENSIRDPSGDLICINDQEVSGGLRYKPGQKMVHMIPLIVPPIYEKGSRFQNIVGPLWVEASSAITQAHSLLIFGYSFPDTDFAARSLLRRSFYRNDNLSEVSVIDIDPTVASKVSSQLGNDCTHHYKSVPAFKQAMRNQ